MPDRLDMDPLVAPRFLFQGQQAFDALTASLSDVVVVLEPDGDVAYVGPGLSTMLGTAPAEVVGRPFLDQVHPDDRARQEVGRFWASALPFEREFRMRGGDGGWVWVRALSSAAGRDGTRVAAAAHVLGDRVLVLLRDRLGAAPVRDAADVLHEAFDAVNNLVVVADMRLPGAPLVVVNQNFVDTTGYAREEIIGRNCRFLQVRADGTRDEHGDGQDQALATIRAALESGGTAEVVLRNYRKDGSLFYNRLFLTPILDGEGEVTHFVGVQNDVTTEIEQGRETERQRALLQAFFDSAPYLMGVVEHRAGQVRHLMANQAAVDLLRSDGATFDRVEGQALTGLGFTEAEAARWERHVRACEETAEPVHFETVFPWGADPSGHGTRRLDVVVNVAAREQPLFSYVAEDVTERRRADAERRLLAAAVEHAAEPIVVTDAALDAPGPRILYANQAHVRTFGYTLDEVIGQNPRMFQGPKTDRAMLDRIRSRLDAGEPTQSETVNYRKDGSDFLLQWEIAPVRDEAGTVVNWVGTQRDVTDQRRLEREILEVAAREQERMARDLHDGLGQVLTGAAFRLQALHNTLAQSGEAELAADALRTRELVEGALDQARAVARGLFPLTTEPDGLAEALGRLAADATIAFGIACTFTGEPVAVASREHAAHLYRIAQEALANAARHARAQTVEIGLTRRGDTATLSIRDDGVGIPEAALAGGDGLGLRTMRYRADRLGGEFEVRPREGGGTVVAVTFAPAPDAPAD